MIDDMKKILPPECCKSIEEISSLSDDDSGMCLPITDLPKDAIICCVPKKGVVHIGIDHDYKKSCDYLILIPRNNQNDHTDIYFIEMKTTLSCKKIYEACDQIISTIPPLDYLISIIKNHLEKDPNFDPHFIILGLKAHKNLPKRTIKSESPECITVKKHKFAVIYPVNQISRDMLEKALQ